MVGTSDAEAERSMCAVLVPFRHYVQPLSPGLAVQVRRLNMYKTKAVRDKKGKVIHEVSVPHEAQDVQAFKSCRQLHRCTSATLCSVVQGS